MSAHIPFRQALLWIIGSTLLISGTAALILFSSRSKSIDESGQLTTIVSTSGSKDRLKSAILEEILELSFDQPITLSELDIDAATEKLLSHPIIESAKISKIPPDTLFVDYDLKEPVAEVINWKNCAMDSIGNLFPLIPFYSPKRLPKVYFEEVSKQLQLFETISKSLSDMSIEPVLIDLSKVNSESLGRREIDLLVDSNRTLRLHHKDWQSSLKNYQRLRENGLLPGQNEPVTVDLRSESFALIKENS